MIETNFTPWASLGGGTLIGLAAVLLMGLLGRVFGVTGILAGAITFGASHDRLWRLALLAGMISGPVTFAVITGEIPTIQVPVSTTFLAIGGLLVGIGATLGSGCTSGHGICGLARLSPRSLVATFVFMLTAAGTVFIIRHVFGG